MGRQIKFVPAAQPSAPKEMGLEDIPEDVREEIEGMYANMKGQPNGRFEIVFDTKAERLQYETWGKVYAAKRPAGPIWFRKSPIKNAADTTGYYRVADLPTDNGKKAIEDATQAVKDAAAETPDTPAKSAPAKATPSKKTSATRR